MSSKILPIHKKAVFEPHLYSDRELPFTFDTISLCVCDRGICNFHENIEFLYFNEGKGLVYIDNCVYNVEKGDIIAINSYSTHQVVSEEGIVHTVFILDKDFCKLNDIDVFKLRFEPKINDPKLVEMFDNVREAWKSESYFKCADFKTAALNFLLYVCHNHCTVDNESKTQNLTKECVIRSSDYIKQHLSEKILVDDVASYVGLSRYHFLREFKKYTGFTLTNYINIIRCEYAKDLLKSGKHKIKEISSLCGFENFSYFTNVFKKHTGMRPSDFISK